MAKKNRLIKYALLTVLLGGAAFWDGSVARRETAWAIQGSAPTAPASKPDAAPPAERKSQTTFTVTTGDLTGTVVITGELRAAKSREISVPRTSSGFASSVTYLPLEGASIKQGERLLEFDVSSILSQKSEAQRRLDEARLRISKTQADQEAQRCDLRNGVAQAESNLKVAQLYARIGKDLLTNNEYEKYQMELERSKLALERAREVLANQEAGLPSQMALVELEKAQAEVDLKKIEMDLALMQVDAPQDGIIIYGDNWMNNRKVQIGDTIFPGMPVLTLPDLSSMEVVGFIYDTDLHNLSPGMVCNIRLDAAPGKLWSGKIASLTSVASRKGFASQHKVFKAIVKLDAVEAALMKPGMTARIEAQVTLAYNTVNIPREYLAVDAQGDYFVRKGMNRLSATVQKVKVGAFSERSVQIIEGLNTGDTIAPTRASAEGQ